MKLGILLVVDFLLEFCKERRELLAERGTLRAHRGIRAPPERLEELRERRLAVHRPGEPRRLSVEPRALLLLLRILCFLLGGGLLLASRLGVLGGGLLRIVPGLLGVLPRGFLLGSRGDGPDGAVERGERARC